ncbi:MAG: site-specific DNA-methyltransferase [Planctomycetota bacterium]
MPRWLKQVQEVIEGKRRFALIPGDCLDLGRHLPSGVFDSCPIDPPYGMKYQGLNNNRPPIANDDSPFIWWLHDTFRVLKDDAALACFCNWKNQEAFRFAIEIAGFKLRSHAVWKRANSGMGNTGMTMMPCHDIIWHATKGRFTWPNGRPPSYLDYPNVPTKQRVHSTQKPDPLMRMLARAMTPKGGIVYDPTMGSGSAGVAAVTEGYRFVGVELDPINFDTAKRRVTLAERQLERGPKPCLARLPHATLARGAA